MNLGSPAIEQKFSSPQEELEYLRAKVAENEQAAGVENGPTESAIVHEVRTYQKMPAAEVLNSQYEVPAKEVETLAIGLAPEAHDVKIQELYVILKEKGIKNALSVVDALNDPHVEDDFHRFIVQYVKTGHEVLGLKPKSALFRTIAMTLYEISLPDEREDDKQKVLKEIISAMEQFYAGMRSLEDKDDWGRYIALEIANPNHSDEFIFYVAVPDAKKNLFEKQIMSLFPNAKVKETPDDYNIFNEGGVALGAVATLEKHPILPLKTYEKFDHDPLNVILNAFSKMKKHGEGAALQIVFRPASMDYLAEYKATLAEVEKGTKLKDALPKTFAGEIFGTLKEVFFTKEKTEEEKKKEKESLKIDEIAVQNIREKITSPIGEVNVRIITSAETSQDAETMLSDLESGFHQFENTNGNKIVFKRVNQSGMRRFAKDFSFRAFSESDILLLNIKELTTIFHFPGATIKMSPQLRQARSGTAAAPVDLPTSGTLLGINRFRNIETKAYMTKDDRLRHFYTIGQTGTGKSTLLKNMIAQDILQGEGVCMIDPHGIDIMDILAIIPPERYDDLIYFDPSYTARPMGLNMLEFDPNFPEQKTFVVNELLSIFKKLYGAVPESMGPAFEQYFRNASLLVMEDPESGNTLVDISRVLSDKSFREYKLAHCKNPLIKQFWENATKTTGDQGLANYTQYVTNKFDVFLANDIMRPIISQEKSAFNFREIMDSKKILLVNLAKGRLGDINSHLIGLIIVGKFLMAALSRADSAGKDFPPFYLYIDEFQNTTTDSISTILSEARKYKLSLNIAHQYIAQLDEKTRDAVFGNVGSIAAFRVGSADAEYLEKQFAPVFTASDLINIDNRNAYARILVNGRPVKAFNIETLPPPKGIPGNIDKLKELSYLKYGRERASVEADIMEKYQSIKKPAETIK